MPGVGAHSLRAKSKLTAVISGLVAMLIVLGLPLLVIQGYKLVSGLLKQYTHSVVSATSSAPESTVVEGMQQASETITSASTTNTAGATTTSAILARYARSISAAGLHIAVIDTVLWVRSSEGITSIGFYSEQGEKLVAVVYPSPFLESRSAKTLKPLYAAVSNDNITIAVSLPDVFSLAGARRVTIGIYVGHEHSLTFDVVKMGDNYFIDIGSVEEDNTAEVSVCEALMSEEDIMYALVCSINTTSVNIIKAVLIGSGYLSGDEAHRIWQVLKWEDERTEYGYVKYKVETPLEFLEYRRGRCIDYAVFTIAALFAAGFNEAYLVTLEPVSSEKDLVGHAFVAAPLNGTLVVLDQRPPALELQDYLEYVVKPYLDIGSRIISIRVKWVSGKAVVEWGRTVDREFKAFTYTDTYPTDMLPLQILIEAGRRAAKRYGLGFNFSREKPEGPWVGETLWYSMCSLEPYVASKCEHRVSYARLYSPFFREEWIEFLADRMAKYIPALIEDFKSYFDKQPTVLWLRLIHEEPELKFTIYVTTEG